MNTLKLLIPFLFIYFINSTKIHFLTTNDLHSHFEGIGPDAYINSKSPPLGHYSRLSSKINSLRNQLESKGDYVFVMDAGDYTSGTLFQTLGPSNFSQNIPEYEFFSYCNFDAITIGNHEYDMNQIGIDTTFQKAKNLDLKVNLITTDIEFHKGSEFIQNEFYSNNTRIIEYGKPQKNTISITPTQVIKVNTDITIGILGIMGPNAAWKSSNNRKTMSFKAFDDYRKKSNFSKQYFDRLRNIIQNLKKDFGVNFIAILLHGGLNESRILNNELDVNLIAGGHTGEKYSLIEKETILTHGGCCGERLTFSSFEINEQKKFFPDQAQLIEINGNIPFDETYLKIIESYKNQIKNFEFKYNEEIITLKSDFNVKEEYQNPASIQIMTLVLEDLNRIFPNDHVDVYISNIGMIRGGLTRANNQDTKIQFSDIFKILSLGFDSDLNPGSPICHFYLPKSALWMFINIYELYTYYLNENFPVYSDSLTIIPNNWGIPFWNAYDIKLNGKNYGEWPELIHIALPEYVSKFFEKVSDYTFGLWSMPIMDKNNNLLNQSMILKYEEKSQKEFICFARSLKKKESL